MALIRSWSLGESSSNRNVSLSVNLEKIADFAYNCGKDGAQLPSWRGNHEPVVPQELQENEENK